MTYTFSDLFLNILLNTDLESCTEADANIQSGRKIAVKSVCVKSGEIYQQLS